MFYNIMRLIPVTIVFVMLFVWMVIARLNYLWVTETGQGSKDDIDMLDNTTHTHQY